MLLLPPLPKRNNESYKYNYGHVLAIGGSYGMSGAVCLLAEAAMRSGCGLVSLGVPAELHDVVATKLTESMVLPLAAKDGVLAASALSSIDTYVEERKVNVLAVGCGMRKTDATMFLMRKLLTYTEIPMVLDADALNCVSEFTSLLKKSRSQVVLTPHRGEFLRLSGLSNLELDHDRKKAVLDFTREHECVLVLKGPQTIVCDGNSFVELDYANSALATAGSGDVLTGIIAAMIAQGMTVYDSAVLGVALHGMSGAQAANTMTEYCVTAGDLVRYLPSAFKKMQKK